MESSNFIDHYEILEIGPNANSVTVERMFRHFARLYHPDNKETGDRLGWIAKENGMLAITVEGIDRITSVHRQDTARKLLTGQTPSLAA